MTRFAVLVAALLLWAGPALAQGRGIYTRGDCNTISSPETGFTWCGEANSRTWKVWNGSIFESGIGATINGLGGSITLQGTANQVNVGTVGSVITLSAPQDLAKGSTDVVFGKLGVNLGLSPPLSTLHVAGRQTLSDPATSQSFELMANSYYDGTDRYLTTGNGGAGRIEWLNGAWNFQLAASGTQGVLISVWSLPLSLNSGGASVAGFLDVYGTNRQLRLFDADASNYVAIRSAIAIASNYIIELGNLTGANGDCLTRGTLSGGVLPTSWTPCGGGGAGTITSIGGQAGPVITINATPNANVSLNTTVANDLSVGLATTLTGLAAVNTVNLTATGTINGPIVLKDVGGEKYNLKAPPFSLAGGCNEATGLPDDRVAFLAGLAALPVGATVFVPDEAFCFSGQHVFNQIGLTFDGVGGTRATNETAGSRFLFTGNTGPVVKFNGARDFRSRNVAWLQRGTTLVGDFIEIAGGSDWITFEKGRMAGHSLGSGTAASLVHCSSALNVNFHDFTFAGRTVDGVKGAAVGEICNTVSFINTFFDKSSGDYTGVQVRAGGEAWSFVGPQVEPRSAAIAGWIDTTNLGVTGLSIAGLWAGDYTSGTLLKASGGIARGLSVTGSTAAAGTGSAINFDLRNTAGASLTGNRFHTDATAAAVLMDATTLHPTVIANSVTSGLVSGTPGGRAIVDNLAALRLAPAGGVNVGIGPTAPLAPLFVSGTSNSSTLDLNGHIMVVQNLGGGNLPFVIDNSGTGNPNFAFSINGVIKGTVAYSRSGNFLGLTNIAYSSSDLSVQLDAAGNFKFLDSITSAERLRFTPGGLVGIGTTSPSFTLDVVGLNKAARLSRLTLADANTASSFDLCANCYYNSGADTYLVNGFAGRLELLPADGTWKIQTAPSGTANTGVALTTRVSVTQPGYVGINQLTPVDWLSIGNTTSAAPYRSAERLSGTMTGALTTTTLSAETGDPCSAGAIALGFCSTLGLAGVNFPLYVSGAFRDFTHGFSSASAGLSPVVDMTRHAVTLGGTAGSVGKFIFTTIDGAFGANHQELYGVAALTVVNPSSAACAGGCAIHGVASQVFLKSSTDAVVSAFEAQIVNTGALGAGGIYAIRTSNGTGATSNLVTATSHLHMTARLGGMETFVNAIELFDQDSAFMRFLVRDDGSASINVPTGTLNAALNVAINGGTLLAINPNGEMFSAMGTASTGAVQSVCIDSTNRVFKKSGAC